MASPKNMMTLKVTKQDGKGKWRDPKLLQKTKFFLIAKHDMSTAERGQLLQALKETETLPPRDNVNSSFKWEPYLADRNLFETRTFFCDDHVKRTTQQALKHAALLSNSPILILKVLDEQTLGNVQ